MNESSDHPEATPTASARTPPGGWITFALLLGATLFLLWFVPTERWTESFAHPLRTDSEGRPPTTTVDGARLLNLILPITGILWIAAGALLHRFQSTSQANDTARPSRSSICTAVLAVILIVGCVLRLILARHGLWYDEVVAFWYYGQYGPGPITGNMFTPANHVLQSLSSWAVVTASGGSLHEILLRLPSIVFGLLAAWPIHALARRVLGHEQALIATAIILFAPIAVLESAEARGYAMMLFFASSSSALLVAALEDRRLVLLVPYALACALGIWSHLVTACVPIGHVPIVLWIIFRDPTRRRIGIAALGALLLAGMTAATLLAPVIPDLLASRDGFRATDSDQPRLLGPEGLDLLLGLGGAWGILGALPALILVLLGIADTISNKRTRLALAATGLPIATALALALSLDTWIYARFLVFELAFLAIAGTAGLALIRRTSGALMVIAMLLVVSSWTFDLAARPPRQPVKAILAEIPDDGSLIASVGIPDMEYVLAWYMPTATGRIVDAGAHIANAVDVIADPRVHWVVLSYPSRSTPELMDAIEHAGFTEKRRLPGWIDHGEGELVLLERSGRPKPTQS